MKKSLLSVFVICTLIISASAQVLVPSTGAITITTCSGTIQDAGGTGNYLNNSNGSLTILPEAGKSVYLSFTQFSIFSDVSDILNIYDATTTTTSLIGNYRTSSPGTVTASNLSGALTIRFFANSSNNDVGFTATIGCLSTTDGAYLVPYDNAKTVSGCSGKVTDHAYFGSPFSNAKGTLTLLPSTVGKAVTLHFSTFSLAGAGALDYLTLYNGVTTASPSMGRYGSSNTINTITASNLQGAITLKFETNSSSNKGNGFVASLGCVATTPGAVGFIATPYEGNKTIVGCNGIVTDPNGFDNYLANSNGTLTILPTAPGLNIKLSFNSFSLFNGIFDYLKIHNGPSTASILSGQYNTTIPSTIESTDASGALTLNFSGYNGGAQGFAANITCVATVTAVVTIPSDNFSVNPQQFSVSSAGGTYLVNITSNKSWNLSTSSDWLTLSTTSGSNNGVISVTLPKYLQPESRSATLQFTAGTLTGMVSITQTGFSGLLAYYPFDGNADNATGLGYNGTVSGATLTKDHKGNDAKAYKFDGIDDYINLGNELGNFGTGDFSVSYMFKIIGNANDLIFSTDPGRKRYIMTKNGLSFSSIFSLYYINAPNTVYVLRVVNTVANSNGSYRNDGYSPEITFDNNWHSVVFIRTSGAFSTYIDGLLATGVINVVNDLNNNKPLLIGSGCGGEIDEIRFYNKALSESETAALIALNSVSGITSTAQLESENQIQLFPNPAQNKLFIANGEGSLLSIFNTLGVLVLKTKVSEAAIDIEALANGLYLVNIEKNGAKKVLKLVVDK